MHGFFFCSKLFLAQASTIASIAFTVGKLFPAHYSCETRLCSKLVHNACMTLCSLVFDLLVVLGMMGVKRYASENSSSGGILDRMLHSMLGTKWAEVVKFLMTLSKSGGLAVSTAWVVKDLVAVSTSAPGQGTLILGSITAAANFLVLLFEFFWWVMLLPKALKLFREVLQVSPQ